MSGMDQPEPTSSTFDLRRGFLRAYAVAWVLWVAYWLVLWPFRIAAHDGIPVGAVYADAVRFPSFLFQMAAVVLVAAPLALLAAAAAFIIAVRWVIRGFRR